MPQGRQQELGFDLPAVTSPSTRKPRWQGQYTEDFERLWKVHPRGGKRTAFRAYLHAVPKLIGAEEVEALLWSYVDGLRDGFRGAHLSTWFRQEYWEQERAEVEQNGNAGKRVAPGSAARWIR